LSLIPASPSRDAARPNSPGRVSQLQVRNLGLCVICALLIENCFGRCVIVQNEMNRTLAFLGRERLKREDVDVLIGESEARLSKRSRLVFLADCELLSDSRHGRNLLAVYLGMGWKGPARSYDVSHPTPATCCIKGETRSLYCFSYTTMLFTMPRSSPPGRLFSK
jgi:hypothetical protein